MIGSTSGICSPASRTRVRKSRTGNATLASLAAVQAVDAAICVKPIPHVAKCLDDVNYPREGRWIFPVVKAAAALGLLVEPVSPVAELTLIMLTIYFSLAVGYHLRAKDIGLNAASASSLLAVCGALTVTELRRGSLCRTTGCQTTG